MPMSCSEAQEALVSLLNRLSREWTEFDASEPSENVPLYLLCGSGLTELHATGRAWSGTTALDFEATLCGVWIDADRRSILPDELRRVVPAWAGQAVAVQLEPRMRVRLTLDGQAAQDVVRHRGPAGFLEYICGHPVPGRVQVRILGNQGPAPGAVHSDPLAVTVSNWAEGAQAFASALRRQPVAVARGDSQPPDTKESTQPPVFLGGTDLAAALNVSKQHYRTFLRAVERLRRPGKGKPPQLADTDYEEVQNSGRNTPRFKYRANHPAIVALAKRFHSK